MESISGWIPKKLFNELCQKYRIEGKTKSERLKNLLEHISKDGNSQGIVDFDSVIQKLDYDIALLRCVIPNLRELIIDLNEWIEKEKPKVLEKQKEQDGMNEIEKEENVQY
jgi:hypothetical protein